MTFTERVAEMIKIDFILSQKCPPDTYLPTVRQLSKQYATSLSTISNALNFLEIQGIVKKIQGKGTLVTKPEPEKHVDNNTMITLVLPRHQDSELSMRVFKGVEQSCVKRSWSLILKSGNNTYETERKLFIDAFETGSKGVVVLPVPRFIEQIRSDYLSREFSDFPVSLIDLTHPDQGHIQVVFDNKRAGYEMTIQLIKRGHRHIAFMRDVYLQSILLLRSNQERYEGYLAAMHENGYEPSPDLTWDIGAFDITKTMQERIVCIEQHLQQWIESSNRATVIIALDDFWAHIISTEARAMGIRIPDDLDISGFDNLAINDSIRNGLLTTNPDFTAAGEIALNLLADQIDGRLKLPVTYILPVPVICKSSHSNHNDTKYEAK